MFRDVVIGYNMLNNKNLTDDEIWKIISEKYNDKNDYTKDFIFRSIKKYGDIYTYEKSNRIKWTDTVIVTCPKHGDFKVYPNIYLNKNGIGCPKCKKLIKKELQFIKGVDKFEKKLKKKFPNLSIVDKSKYKGHLVKIKFRCNLDGCEFSATPNSILVGGSVCPKCKEEKLRKKQESNFVKYFYKHFTDGELLKNSNGHIWDKATVNIVIKSKYTGEIKEFTTKSLYQRIERGTTTLFKSTRLINAKNEFIRKAIKKFGRKKFKYDKVNYVNDATPVIIICGYCGKEFTVLPSYFLRDESNYDCICRVIHKKFNKFKRKLSNGDPNIELLTTEEDILKAGVFNGDTIVKLKCKKCGSEFSSKVSYVRSYLREYSSVCRSCVVNNHVSSRGELVVQKWLVKNNIEFKSQFRLDHIVGRNTNLVIVDFALNINNKKCFIEYNGQQHYKHIEFFDRTDEDFMKQVQRDNNLREYCLNNDIIFIEIPYTYTTERSIFNILEKILIKNKDPKEIIKLPKIEI